MYKSKFLVVIFLILTSLNLFSEEIIFTPGNIKFDIPEGWTYSLSGEILNLTKGEVEIEFSVYDPGSNEINLMSFMAVFNEISSQLKSEFGDINITSGPTRIRFQGKKGIETEMENNHNKFFRSIIFSPSSSIMVSILITSETDNLSGIEDEIEDILSSVSLINILILNEEDRYYSEFGKYSLIIPDDWELIQYYNVMKLRTPILDQPNENQTILYIYSTTEAFSFVEDPISDAMILMEERDNISDDSILVYINEILLSSGQQAQDIEEIELLDIGGATAICMKMPVNLEPSGRSLELIYKTYLFQNNNLRYHVMSEALADSFDIKQPEFKEILNTFRFESSIPDDFNDRDNFILNEENRYYNQEGHFSIIVPEEWEIEENLDIREIDLISPLQKYNFNIPELIKIAYGNAIDEQSGAEMTLEDIYEDRINMIKSNLSGEEVIEGSTFQLNGLDFKWFIYQYPNRNFLEINLILITVYDQKFYIFIYSSNQYQFEINKEVFFEILSTFRWE